jgi:hypothetical protein
LEYVSTKWSESTTFLEVETFLKPLVKGAVEKARAEKIPELEGKIITANQLNHAQNASFGQNSSSASGESFQLFHTNSNSSNDSQEPTMPLGPGNPVEKHRYTTWLYETGVAEGVKPEFDYTQLSSNPMRWHCRASFRGCIEEAFGNSTKAARHEASSRICARLGAVVK